MSIKLIAIDMDGTLLNSDNEVSLRTKKALEMAKKKGIYVVISTGRIFVSAKYYAKLLGTKAPVISSNGAFVAEQETGKVIYESPININNCIKVVKILESKNICFYYYGQKDFFAGGLSEIVMLYYNWNCNQSSENQINIKIINNHVKFLEEERPIVYKFFILEEDSRKLKEIEKILKEDKNIEISTSGPNNLEIMNQRVSKGEALKKLCERLNIRKEEVAAIGDSFNDVTMLQFAEIPIAMGNAERYIKDMAKFVTDTNNNDGVAKAIEKLISRSDSIQLPH